MLLFAAAALGKLRAPRDWRALAGEATGPGGLASVVVVAVPLAEAAVAGAIVVRPAAGLAAGAVLLLALTGAVAARLDRLAGRPCACFGRPGSTRFGRPLVVRNALLAMGAAGGAAYFAIAGGAGPRGVELGAAVVVVALAVAGRAFRRRPSTLVGTSVPVGALEAGRSALVLLVQQGCPACDALVPRTAELRAQLGVDEVIVAARGETVEADELFALWRVAAVPFAVLIDPQGFVAGTAPADEDGLAELAAVSRARAGGPRLDRRQALALGARGLAALAVGAALPAGAWAVAARPRRPGRSAAEDPNVFKGTCAGWAKYVIGTGAYYDRYGRNAPSHHKGVWGHTRIWPEGSRTVGVTVTKLDERKIDNASALCDCPAKPSQLYFGREQVTKCVTDCPGGGLACAHWQCKVMPGEVCICAHYQAKIQPPPIEITVLRWEPPDGASKSCRALAKQMNDDTTQHEQRHKQDALDAIRDTEKTYKRWQICACAKTEGQARRSLEEKAAELPEQVRREVFRLEQSKVEEFHKSEAGGDSGAPLTIDCRLCGE